MKQCGTKYFQNLKKPPLMMFKSRSSRIISGLIGELFVLVISSIVLNNEHYEAESSRAGPTRRPAWPGLRRVTRQV
jgi:hypothetical protein